LKFVETNKLVILEATQKKFFRLCLRLERLVHFMDALIGRK